MTIHVLYKVARNGFTVVLLAGLFSLTLYAANEDEKEKKQPEKTAQPAPHKNTAPAAPHNNPQPAHANSAPPPATHGVNAGPSANTHAAPAANNPHANPAPANTRPTTTSSTPAPSPVPAHSMQPTPATHNVGTPGAGANVHPGGANAGGNPGGHVNASGGWQGNNTPHNAAIHTLPANGSHERTVAGGSVIRTRPNGRVSDIHDARRGMDIHHDLMGGRSIVIERPDHSRSFFAPGRPGFVQHPYNFHGQSFARRTYIYNGRTYSNFYRGYSFHGVFLNLYAPSVYYHPGFYGWAYRPWDRPVVYRWGWGGMPWYSRFGFYFSPYPSYPSAAYWLTDYMISANLQAQYNAQVGGGMSYAPPPMGGQVMLSPDVKQMIADEVHSQLMLEGQQAQQQNVDPADSGIGAVLNDVANGHPHIFMVNGSQDAVDNYGNECALSDGDVLALRMAPAPDSVAADLQVLASKGGIECRRGSTVSLTLDSLQEMQNQMRAMLDQGLQDLQAKQGQGGLPMAPPGSGQQPAPYTSVAPPEDVAAANQLQQQAQQADQVESQDESAAPAGSGPATIAVGQSIGQVEQIMGQPKTKALVGSRTIYDYGDLKVTFLNGTVTNIQ